MCKAKRWWRTPRVLVQMAELSAEAVHHVVCVASHQPLQARIPAWPFLVGFMHIKLCWQRTESSASDISCGAPMHICRHWVVCPVTMMPI